MPVAGRHGVFQAGRQGMQGRMALGRLISWRRPGSAFTPALKAAATVDRVAQARVAAAGRPYRQGCGRRRHAALLQEMVPAALQVDSRYMAPACFRVCGFPA